MAGVFVDTIVALVHHHLGAPWLRVVHRIIDLECVEQLAIIRAAEPLGQLAFGRQDHLPLPRLLGVDVAGVDHQRVALIPAYGIAKPWLDRGGPVLGLSLVPGDRDYARIMHHLDQDHHMIGRLDDLVIVVVNRVQHTRTASIREADQAAFGDG